MILRKIKRLLNRCDDCYCWRKARHHFILPDHAGLERVNGKERKEFEEKYNEKIEDYYYCYKHAENSGFCLGCGYFLAGTDSFDFSKCKGYCQECIDEINADLGYVEYPGEYMGEYDYYDNYTHNFDEKQPQGETT